MSRAVASALGDGLSRSSPLVAQAAALAATAAVLLTDRPAPLAYAAAAVAASAVTNGHAAADQEARR